MSDGINYEVVINGIEKAIRGLREMNAELDRSAQAGQAHAHMLESLESAIKDIAKNYAGAEDEVASYMREVTEGSKTTLEGLTRAASAQATLNRSMGQGKTAIEAVTNARAKDIRVANKAAKATKDQESATESAIAAEQQLAETKKKSSFSGRPQDITQALTQVANRDSADVNSAAIAAAIAAEKQNNEIVLRGYLQQKDAAEAAAKTEQAGIRKTQEMYEDLFTSVKSLRQQAEIDQFGSPDRARRQNELNSVFQSKASVEQERNIQKAIDDEAQARIDAADRVATSITKSNFERLEAEEKAIRDEFKLEGDLLEQRNKLRREAIREAIAADEEEFQRKLKQAKKFLALEQDIANGTINKDKVGNRSSQDFVDIAAGANVVRDVEANPQEFTRLAAAIHEVKEELEGAARAKALFAERAQAANKQVKEFTLSWQTMGRIIVAQAFNEAFFAIQNGIRQSVTEAEELFKAVAEIQTIVSQSSRGLIDYFGALESVLRVSSEINFTPQDTANAFYETLSNQIGDNVTQIRAFIQEAGNLGKITRSTLADSADAITAVMNSYNEGIDQAHDISAKLFTLVDQGRVKLDEVANHMGNVSVPAAQLGVDFDNVVAALSAISIAGIPAREAMTLQRNVMFKLIDPTERMTALFKQWGVSSAHADIAAFGFEGVLRRLAVEALKGNEEVAALMGTIRGTRGILGLTGENFDKYKKALEASREATENYTKTVEEYLANPGEKFAKLQQEISNEFLRMGLRIVDLVVTFNDFIQGTDEGNSKLASLLGTAARITLVIGGATTAFLIVSSAIAAVVAAAGTLAIAFAVGGPVIAGVAAVTAGVAGLAAILTGAVIGIAAFTKSAEQKFGEIQAAASEMNKDVAKSFEEGILGTLNKDTNDILEESSSVLAKVAASISRVNEVAKEKEAKKALEDLADGLDRLIKAFGGSEADQKLIRIFSSAEDIANLYGNSANWTTDGIDKLTDAHEKEADAIQKVIDKLQEQRNKLLDVAKANRIALAESVTERNINALPENQRGAAQFAAAQGAANAALNAGSSEESQRLFDTARKFLQEAERTAFETGAFGTIERHTQFFNQQEAELNALQERRLANEDQFIARQQESASLQRDYHRGQQEIGQAELDRRKELETQFALEKAFLQEYIRLRDQILDPKSDLAPEERTRRLGVLNQQAAAGLDRIGASPFTRNQFQAELEKNQATLMSEALSVEEEKLTKSRQEATEALNQAEAATKKYGDTMKDVADKVATAIGILDQKTNTNLTPGGPGGGVAVDQNQLEAMKAGDALQAEMEALAEANIKKQLSEEDYFAALADLQRRAVALAEETGIDDPVLIDALEAAYQAAELAMIQRQSAVALSEQSRIVTNELANLTQQVNAAAAAFGSLQGQSQTRFPDNPTAMQFAKGGPVGSDTIPAWLSKGEYVVNARAARENFDYLQAINYGGGRRTYSNGGPVTNTQTFHSTFNVSSNNPTMQVNTIVNAMRRQISQGKATLSKRTRPY